MCKNTVSNIKQDSVMHHTEFMNKKAKEFLVKTMMIFALWIIFDFVKQVNNPSPKGEGLIKALID